MGYETDHVEAVYNIPVLLDGDRNAPLGWASVNNRGIITIELHGEHGEDFNERCLNYDMKHIAINYAWSGAVPKVPKVPEPRESEITVIDGADGLTPDMFRNHPVSLPEEKEMTKCRCGIKHVYEDIAPSTLCSCGRMLFGQTMPNVLNKIKKSLENIDVRTVFDPAKWGPPVYGGDGQAEVKL